MSESIVLCGTYWNYCKETLTPLTLYCILTHKTLEITSTRV